MSAPIARPDRAHPPSAFALRFGAARASVAPRAWVARVRGVVLALAGAAVLVACGGGAGPDSSGGGSGGGGGSAVGDAITPRVTAPPVSGQVIVGQLAGFHVEAAGPALGFAWEQQLPGGDWQASTASVTSTDGASDLTFGPVDIGASGARFRSAVSNAQGSVTSSDAVLTVTWGRMTTLEPNNLFDFGPGAGGFGSADGGTPGGGDGEGAGVGGGLGKTRQVRITINRVADNAPLGQAVTGANTGLARVKAGPGTAPVLLTMEGSVIADYYDEGKDTMLRLGADQRLHSLVLSFDRHLGVTPLTEAAYRYALNQFLQDPAAVRAGSVPLKRTASADEIARLTPQQIQAAQEAVRGQINLLLPTRYQIDSVATLPTPVDNASPVGSISDNIYGRMQAVVGGLALAAGRFNPSLGNPALTMTAQLADDLTDGVIDGRSLDGQSVFGAPGAAYDVGALAQNLTSAADAQVTRFGDNTWTQTARPPAITSQPSSATITQGGRAVLSVAATGSVLTYQWLGNGQPVGLDQPVLETSTAGTYQVRISNPAGSVTSTAVVVTVSTAVAVAAPSITTQPASASVTSGDSHTFRVVATGTNLRYQWFIVVPPSQGQTAPSFLALQGETAPSFTTVVVVVGTYYVTVTNEAGTVRSADVILTPTPRVTAPVITQQPVAVYQGQTATITVSVSGSSPTFQWFGPTGRTGNGTNPLITSVPGIYYVLVSNSAGSVESDRITVIAAPTITSQPVSATVVEGATATFTVAASGTGPSYQWFSGATAPTAIAGATAASYTTRAAGTYLVEVRNSAGSVRSAAVTLTLTPAVIAPVITTQPASITINAGQTTTLSVVATGTSPTYQWRLNGTDIAGATTASYSTGAAGTYTVVVSNSAGTVTSAAATVTVVAITAPAITTQPASATVAAGQTHTFSVAATGTSPTYQWSGPNGVITGATSASYTTGGAGSYFVQVSNAAGTVRSSTVTLTVVTPIAITTQPASVTINAGQNTTLRVAATGTSPTYQWQRNGTNITAATAASYTTGTAGVYTVVVSNAAGSVTSSAATVTVITTPVITTQPVSASVASGQTHTFSVAATGGSLSYQWQVTNNSTGSNINGATASTYTTGTLGTYRVIVRNPVGQVTSATATLSRGTTRVADPATDALSTDALSDLPTLAKGDMDSANVAPPPGFKP